MGKSEMAKPVQSIAKSADARSTSSSTSKVCGIVMPIAAMGERYTEAHWTRVRLILQRAIERAGMRHQLVWENPEVDVIQSAILQNIYENDVVVCDVSNLNPNVMLETGLRLSTRKPTIIVTDKEMRPPFDISTIGYIDYQSDLEYNSIETFINKLSKKIREVSEADDSGKYQSYVSQFKFETVQPTSVTVSSDEYIKDRLNELTAAVRQLTRSSVQIDKRPLRRAHRVAADMGVQDAMAIEDFINSMPMTSCSTEPINENRFRFIITVEHDDKKEAERTLEICSKVIFDADTAFSSSNRL